MQSGVRLSRALSRKLTSTFATTFGMTPSLPACGDEAAAADEPSLAGELPTKLLPSFSLAEKNKLEWDKFDEQIRSEEKAFLAKMRDQMLSKRPYSLAALVECANHYPMVKRLFSSTPGMSYSAQDLGPYIGRLLASAKTTEQLETTILFARSLAFRALTRPYYQGRWTWAQVENFDAFTLNVYHLFYRRLHSPETIAPSGELVMPSAQEVPPEPPFAMPRNQRNPIHTWLTMAWSVLSSSGKTLDDSEKS